MNTFLPVITLSLLLCGCQKQGQPQEQPPLVIEDATPIVGANETTTEALGIETLGGVFTPLIQQGTKVPCTRTEVFSTAADGQTKVMVSPFRGTNQMAMNNHALGRFQIVDIPSAPRGMPQVEVTFTITKRKILLSARDQTRQKELHVQRLSEDTKP